MSALTNDPSEAVRDRVREHELFWSRSLREPLVNTRSSTAVQFQTIPALHERFRGAEGLDLEPSMFEPEVFQPGPLRFPEEASPHLCGRLFNVVLPYPRVPWLPGIAGCRLMLSWSAQTVWVGSSLPQDWHRRSDLGFRPRWEWLEKLLEFQRFNVRAHGAAAVPTLDLLGRGVGDLLVNILGAERAYLALYDHPEEVKALLGRLTDLHISWAAKQLEILPRIDGGYCNQYGLHASGGITRFQEDLAGMLSPDQFREFLLPCEERICAAFDHAVLHTHSGVPVLPRHALEMRGLRALDVVLDAAGPTPRELVPVLNRLLESKAVIVSGVLSRSDLDLLVAEVSPGGLLLDVAVEEELESRWG